MANSLPRFIMRNNMLYVGKTSYLGQIAEIVPPVPTEVTVEIRNSGMIKARKIGMGYEALEFSFQMPGVDPEILKLMGVKTGRETDFLATGACVSEDGTVGSAVLEMRGRMTSANGGTWKPGTPSDNNYGVNVNYYRFEFNGQAIYEMDDFDFKVFGESIYADIRNAMLLT